MAKTIYTVESGEYSDHTIYAAFTGEAQANRVAEALGHDYWVGQLPLDPETPEELLSGDVSDYRVFFRGRLHDIKTDVSRYDMSYAALSDDYPSAVINVFPKTPWNNFAYVAVLAKSEDAAIKAAQEHLMKHIATYGDPREKSEAEFLEYCERVRLGKESSS